MKLVPRFITAPLERWIERRATELTYDQIAALLDGNGRMSNVAGMVVNERTALRVASVLACQKVLGDGCATPPLHVFRDIGKPGKRRRELATDLPIYRLLHRRPNAWQTSFEWRRMMTVHSSLAGMGLSIITRGRDRAGAKDQPLELIPVPPGNFTVLKPARYEVVYRCFDEFGLIGDFSPRDVFCLHNLQWHYLGALDAINLAANVLGLTMASEASQIALHKNGLRPSGVYSVEGTLNEEAHKRLSALLLKRQGAEKTGMPLILDRAAKWVSSALTSVDAQADQTRRTQIEEVCRFYGVFPIMVGHSDKTASFASSEAFFSAHLKHTLAPWHESWVQRIDETLLDGGGPLFAAFDTRYLTAGAMKDRAVWARNMAETGIYTRNELRDEEGRDPLDGLDEPLTPLNMAPATAEPKDPEDPEDPDAPTKPKDDDAAA